MRRLFQSHYHLFSYSIISGYFIVLLGATIPFLGIDYEKIQDSIREIFQRKGDAIVELNLKALAAGKEIAEKTMK